MDDMRPPPILENYIIKTPFLNHKDILRLVSLFLMPLLGETACLKHFKSTHLA